MKEIPADFLRLPDRPHSRLGVASFVVSLLALVGSGIGLLIFVAMLMDLVSEQVVELGGACLGGSFLSAGVGFTLGFFGATRPGRKVFAVLGLVFNGVVLLAWVVITVAIMWRAG